MTVVAVLLFAVQLFINMGLIFRLMDLHSRIKRVDEDSLQRDEDLRDMGEQLINVTDAQADRIESLEDTING